MSGRPLKDISPSNKELPELMRIPWVLRLSNLPIIEPEISKSISQLLTSGAKNAMSSVLNLLSLKFPSN